MAKVSLYLTYQDMELLLAALKRVHFADDRPRQILMKQFEQHLIEYYWSPEGEEDQK